MDKPFPKEAPLFLGDLPEPQFRQALEQASEWVVNYRFNIRDRFVSEADGPGTLTSQLPLEMPDDPIAMDHLFRDFEQLILPRIVHWGHPSFFGYFGSTTNAPGIVGELLAAALNVSALTWATSPAATELEGVVIDWLRRVLQLPEEFFGIVYDTASVGIIHALAAAREGVGLDIRGRGLAGRQDIPPLKLYASDQAHSSIVKAAITLGIGEKNVQLIESDRDFRLDLPALRHAVRQDREAGSLPLAVVATLGTTSTAAVDNVAGVASFCQTEKIWLHVDAAYGGALALLPEYADQFKDILRADSVILNPHKWLFVPLDFSVLYLRHPKLLRDVYSLVPEYLEGDAGPGLVNYMDYGFQLGRRFRALKAWFVFCAFGRAGLAERIREHFRLAKLFSSWIEGDPDLELLTPVQMGVVCFRARLRNEIPGDQTDALNELNRSLVKAVNVSGRAYLTYTMLKGAVATRIGIGNLLTTEADLRNVFQLILHQYDDIIGVRRL